MKEQADIRAVTVESLKTFLEQKGEKPFRAKQIQQWLWEKGVQNFEQMKNLPASLINLLQNHFTLYPSKIEEVKSDNDGTAKVAFQYHDGQVSEGVYIPSGKRVTACVSVQTGCKLNCAFCATGQLQKGRNMTAGEIFDQVFAIREMAEQAERQLTNIVYMGMGEPLLNYDEVIRSIEKITEKPGLEMSPSRVTLSTAGIVPGIQKLADAKIRFNLAISLHSAINETRNQLMPVNKKYPLEKLSEALQYFHQKTNARITFEYLMLKDVNDSVEQARALAEFCKAFPVKINLIEYNTVPEFDFLPSDEQAINQFTSILESRNMIVNLRRSRGKEIDAACGQLANRRQ